MEAPTRRPLHQFFLEYCKAHKILAGFFQPLSYLKNTVYKVASLGRLSLLPVILYESNTYLHTIYVGYVPPTNSFLMPSECIGFPVTNL